jgi:hypothetical protein
MRWLWFAATCALALAIGIVAPRLCDMRPVLVHGVVVAGAANVVLLLACTLGDGVALVRRQPRRALVLAGGAIAATGLVFAVVPPAFRVLADESNLASTSWSLAEHGTLTNVTERLDDRVVSAGIATRPALFPLLAAPLHATLGYHPAHAFAVNFAVCVATLLAIAWIGRRLACWRVGVLAAALLVATPLFDIVVTSAGFDALNHLCLLALLLAAIGLVERPSRAALDRLLLVAALASQARYESALYILPLCVLGRALLRTGPGWCGILAPLLFVPLLLQRSILGTAGMQAGQPELAGHAIFSAEYAPANLCHLGELLLPWPPGAYPVALPVTLLAIAGAVLAVRRRRWCGVGGYLAISLALVLATQVAFRMGDLRTPHNMRLAVIYAGPFALLAAYALHRLVRPRIALALALAMIAVYLPVARRNDIVGRLTLPQEYAHNVARIRAVGGPIVVVDERPGMYVAQGWSAVSFATARRHLARVRAAGTVIVVQHVVAGSVEPAFPAMLLEPLGEYTVAPACRVRLSRLRAMTASHHAMSTGHRADGADHGASR